VEDLKGILNESSDEEDEEDHQAFIFGYSSHHTHLLPLHPRPNQIGSYWNIYKDRVDPLCKILHIPTVEGTVLSAASHLENLSRGFECLLFAIYYATTTSLSSTDCMEMLGEEKEVLLPRYRFGIEQALSRANFLTTEEMVILQAFVIFLICLRRNDDARVIWTLTGLVVRIAQTIGIHRDGCHFELSPFEVEQRRRLWWQVCMIDTRASEDHGCDPTIMEESFDTKLPLNINDQDMTPEMTEFPLERKGMTSISFCLLRYEVSNTFRRLNYIPPQSSITLEDKERWIAECHQKLEERYLQHCDMNVPLFWVTATVARMMMSKMWLMVYHPFQRHDNNTTLSPSLKEKLFITSLENIEYSLLLETETRTKQWSWLFRTYIQWHALAFTLSELCHHPTGPLADRAWRAIHSTVASHPEMHTESPLWRPLHKLFHRAQSARSMHPLTRHYSPNAHPMFGPVSPPPLTRAPLSAAQLQRFHRGPTFGTAPLDKHRLLRSIGVDDDDEDDPVPEGMNWDSWDQLVKQFGMDFD
jgi:hypothetical protein